MDPFLGQESADMASNFFDFGAFGDYSWQSPTGEKIDFGLFNDQDIPIDPALLATDPELSLNTEGKPNMVSSQANGPAEPLSPLEAILNGQSSQATTQVTKVGAFKVGYAGDETLASPAGFRKPSIGRSSAPAPQASAQATVQPVMDTAGRPVAPQLTSTRSEMPPPPNRNGVHYQDPRLQGYNLCMAHMSHQAGPPPYWDARLPCYHPNATLAPNYFPAQGLPQPQQHSLEHHPHASTMTHLHPGSIPEERSEHAMAHSNRKQKGRVKPNGQLDVIGLYRGHHKKPRAQGPIDEDKQLTLKYDRHGEFWPYVKFSSITFQRYLWWTQKNTDSHYARTPTLWIQNHPAMCNKRYPRDSQSFKCRMKQCPVRFGTIHKGMWQVGIDEFPERTGFDIDPFHMAGHCHLWCLERRFDLYELHAHADVRPDVRRFRLEGGRNPMSLRHADDGGDAFIETYNRWMRAQKRKYDKHCKRYRNVSTRPRRQREVEDCLWYQLTLTKIEIEHASRKRMRDKRAEITVESCDISEYMGDLRLWARHVARRNRIKYNREVPPLEAENWEPSVGTLSRSRPREKLNAEEYQYFGDPDDEPDVKDSDFEEKMLSKKQRGKRPATGPPEDHRPAKVQVRRLPQVSRQPGHPAQMYYPTHPAMSQQPTQPVSPFAQAPQPAQIEEPPREFVYPNPELFALTPQVSNAIPQTNVNPNAGWQVDLANFPSADMDAYIDGQAMFVRQLTTTPEQVDLGIEAEDDDDVVITSKRRRSPRLAQGSIASRSEGKSRKSSVSSTRVKTLEQMLGDERDVWGAEEEIQVRRDYSVQSKRKRSHLDEDEDGAYEPRRKRSRV